MAPSPKNDKVLTIQVHHEHRTPRTFKVPLRWFSRAAGLAWTLGGISIFSSAFAIREYLSERSARPELVAELENEVQNLKIALERKNQAGPSAEASPTDPAAQDQRPPEGTGTPLTGKEGVWTGLAEQIATPAPGSPTAIKLEDARVEWAGKYAQFTLTVLYRDMGKGNQQGHLVSLARANDRLYAQPDGVLNTASGSALFDPERGEYFSVSRFRTLRARFGPFESPDQLREIQVFVFDLSNHLLAFQTFNYGK